MSNGKNKKVTAEASPPNNNVDADDQWSKRIEKLLAVRGAEDLPAARMMLAEHLRKRGFHKDVVAAFEKVPRHAFVKPQYAHLAYLDQYLWTDETVLSTPNVVAYMIQELNLSPHARVLEIGTGTGFQTALLSLLANHVFSIDRSPSCIEIAQKALDAFGCSNASLAVGDGYAGWPEQAPYDAIIVAATAPFVPPNLVSQLNPQHGRMVAPIGPAGGGQRLCLIRRVGDRTKTTDLGPTYFVPMVPSGAWDEVNASADVNVRMAKKVPNVANGIEHEN